MQPYVDDDYDFYLLRTTKTETKTITKLSAAQVKFVGFIRPKVHWIRTHMLTTNALTLKMVSITTTSFMVSHVMFIFMVKTCASIVHMLVQV